MTVAKSMVKLGLGKYKIGSSKSEERDVREKDHKEDTDGNGIDDNDGKALGLGSSARGVEAKEAKCKKKPVECFLCHGQHRLRKCPRKFVIEGDNGADNEPKKLGSSNRKVEAKRAKEGKKNQNCPKQSKSIVVKEKASPELVKSSEGLPHEEEVSLSSNLGEKVTIKIVKLRTMRLNSSKTMELGESSVRLSPMEEVNLASDLEGKTAIQTVKLRSMRLISVDTSKGLSLMKGVGCASKFGKVVIQIGQLT
ncbi:hypothetical protein PVK06_005409 [Gossypium arboreum]|uniref:Uncharacterized protein n=1 Tax=Gossypium arboreum TaxID=29729 RepID=A0ABR0QUJ3_GOSAR|nr:hypothetical protein PVK06_005409 [Gossypium arboreum]